jgi:hypothetical protein
MILCFNQMIFSCKIILAHPLFGWKHIETVLLKHIGTEGM